MTTKPLTAVERKRRKEIKELIWDGRLIANGIIRSGFKVSAARTVDDLADVAELYLRGLK